jgi:hypothetical protein
MKWRFIARIWEMDLGFYLTDLVYQMRELRVIEVCVDFGTLDMWLEIAEYRGLFASQAG